MDISNPSILDYLYGFFIMLHIFSFTSILDYSKYSILTELFKSSFGMILLYIQGNIWFNLGGMFSVLMIIYFIISFRQLFRDKVNKNFF